jgi:hypothetical protein
MATTSRCASLAGPVAMERETKAATPFARERIYLASSESNIDRHHLSAEKELV